MTISAIFFDNDGILVDTEHLYLEATRHTLGLHGIDLTDAEYVELFMRQNRGLLHFAEREGWTTDRWQQLRGERNERYRTLLTGAPLVIDGVPDVLRALHGRVRMAVVTSSRRDHFDLIHARTDLLRYFEFVLADGDYAVSKPDPAPYLAAVSRAGLDPAACLVVEDSERGLAAAVAAGLRCVVIPSRLSRGSRFDGAWRVLDDVRQVLGLVDELENPAC